MLLKQFASFLLVTLAIPAHAPAKQRPWVSLNP